MKVTITAFEKAHREALAKLYTEVRATNLTWLMQTIDRSASFDRDTIGEEIWVAKLENKIVGFISIWLQDNFIHHLYIDNLYQGKGIGSQLLKEICTNLESPITLKCMKDNTAAIRFYLKNGWKPKLEAISEDGLYILFEYNK